MMPVKTEEAIEKLKDVIRRKHFSLSTEDSYCGWLKRFCSYIKKFPPRTPSERKVEQFLTSLAKNDVASSTQNQALNAGIYFLIFAA
jgi:site-specific recombinase XerD